MFRKERFRFGSDESSRLDTLATLLAFARSLRWTGDSRPFGKCDNVEQCGTNILVRREGTVDNLLYHNIYSRSDAILNLTHFRYLGHHKRRIQNCIADHNHVVATPPRTSHPGDLTLACNIWQAL
jgi:hypothetical protein